MSVRLGFVIVDLFEARGGVRLIYSGSLIFDTSTTCMIMVGVALFLLSYTIVWIRFRGTWPVITRAFLCFGRDINL